MTTQTQSAYPFSLRLEQGQETPASVSKKATTVPSAVGYWGDRWMLKCWLLCFGLMFAMNLVEALQRLILFLWSYWQTL